MVSVYYNLLLPWNLVVLTDWFRSSPTRFIRRSVWTLRVLYILKCFGDDWGSTCRDSALLCRGLLTMSTLWVLSISLQNTSQCWHEMSNKNVFCDCPHCMINLLLVGNPLKYLIFPLPETFVSHLHLFLPKLLSIYLLRSAPPNSERKRNICQPA